MPFAPDCSQHACRCRDDGDRVRLDACCRYGADVTGPEKIAILRRASEVASMLRPARRDPKAWFDERDPEEDPDEPGSFLVRTAISDPDHETSGCVFLENEGARGCGLHAAALRHGFDPAEIKPQACRIYPFYFARGRLRLSDDFDDYSCAGDGELTVYRVMRDTLISLFGADAIASLDRVEAAIRRPTRLRLAVAR